MQITISKKKNGYYKVDQEFIYFYVPDGKKLTIHRSCITLIPGKQIIVHDLVRAAKKTKYIQRYQRRGKPCKRSLR